ncbi:histone H3-like centromeric protein CENH3 [Rutidosis leptorrhynchoides]|uniref:histone H3-like centromeric protein CENH3 n=1 Tax=Rutidosis leptorrhynchoides TaxID=125765 RepID=UPI003A991569
MARTKKSAKRSSSKRKFAAAAAAPNATTTLSSYLTALVKESKRPYRFKPGTRALQQIRRLQKNVKLLIPAAPFIRTVKEISNRLAPEVTCWQAEALQALQEAAEYYIVLFEDSMLFATHAKRVTLS